MTACADDAGGGPSSGIDPKCRRSAGDGAYFSGELSYSVSYARKAGAAGAAGGGGRGPRGWEPGQRCRSLPRG